MDCINYIDFINNLSKEDKKEIIFNCKEQLLKSGKYDTWKKCQFAQHSKVLAEDFGTDIFKKYELYLGVDDELNEFEKKCCKQLYDSNRKRIGRLKQKIKYNIDNFDCLFLTLTFNDKILYGTSPQTRRDYIRKYLKSLGTSFYCANIDFGDRDKNPYSKEREHYHAVINTGFINLDSYNYGFIFAEKVRKTSNVVKIGKYIDKLTFHAYKDSTRGKDRIIYSR